MSFSDPAQVDLLNERAIVQHIRDMLNLHDLIDGGIEEKLEEFRKRLLSVGWSRDRVHVLEMRASHNTRYERLIPPPIVR